MSMGIYFTAKGEQPISNAEEIQVTEITNKYWEKYPYKEGYEGPGLLSNDSGQVYGGVIRIPWDLSDEEADFFVTYWLKYLTEITRATHYAGWEVNFEGVPLIWEEETGWRMMSNQEYARFYSE